MFDSSKLDAYLTGLCQARDLPGVSAAIMGPDGHEYAFNYGFRDGAFTRPVDNDTLFGVASMSKSMTALCACILACEGRLDLDAPVSDFFPEFELAGQPREAATVRTLGERTYRPRPKASHCRCSSCSAAAVSGSFCSQPGGVFTLKPRPSRCMVIGGVPRTSRARWITTASRRQATSSQSTLS